MYDSDRVAFVPIRQPSTLLMTSNLFREPRKVDGHGEVPMDRVTFTDSEEQLKQYLWEAGFEVTHATQISP